MFMWWMLIGFVVGIFILLYLLVDIIGKEKKIISFIKSNEIEFRMKTGTLDKILENVPGYILKKVTVDLKTVGLDGRTISSQPTEVEKFFPLIKGEKKREHFFGIYWIGLFYPYYSILEWSFSWPKLITVGQEDKEKAKKRTVSRSVTGTQLISYASEKITSLYHVYTYPIEIPDIELQGTLPVSFDFNLKIEVVIPIVPIIILKGNWFEPLTALIKGIISERLKSETLKSLEEMDKAIVFSEIIQKNNDRLVAVTGMKVTDVAYVGYQVAGSDEVKEAATAEKVAELKGKGLVKTAQSTAAATIEEATAAAAGIKLVGDAKSGVLEKLMEVASRRPGGVEVLIEQTRTEGITGFQGNVLSQGTTNPLQMTIDAGEKKKKSKKTSTPSSEDSDEKGESE